MPAFPLTRILVVTDVWLPQVYGVVRAIVSLVREAPALGVEIEILAANEFHTVPLPTFPQLRVAVTRPNAGGGPARPVSGQSHATGAR